MSRKSCLYVGSVFHRRFTPRAHHFRYRLFWLLADLDELTELGRKLRFFSYNRANLFSLRDRDHGDGGDTPLRNQIDRQLAEAGIDLAGGAIQLLCMPRMLGYDFNPISVYFCHRPGGALAALVYEVHNTFGERHSYVLPATRGDEVRQDCAKALFVSPFLPMGLTYEFHVSPPGETLVVAIRASSPDGVALRAALSGRRRALSDAELMRAWSMMPLGALKTMFAIHWEALRLWVKGVPYLGRAGGDL